MKGARTMHGKGITGVGLCKGGRHRHNKKGPQVLSYTKDGALFVPGEDFPFREIGCLTTQEPVSPTPRLCLSLSLTVSHLFLHCIRVGWGAILEREEGQGEELVR